MERAVDERTVVNGHILVKDKVIVITGASDGIGAAAASTTEC